jgi:hypothetical protein
MRPIQYGPSEIEAKKAMCGAQSPGSSVTDPLKLLAYWILESATVRKARSDQVNNAPAQAAPAARSAIRQHGTISKILDIG